MSLWVDKYRPTTLSKLDFHKEQASSLKKLVRLCFGGISFMAWRKLTSSTANVSCILRHGCAYKIESPPQNMRVWKSEKFHAKQLFHCWKSCVLNDGSVAWVGAKCSIRSWKATVSTTCCVCEREEGGGGHLQAIIVVTTSTILLATRVTLIVIGTNYSSSPINKVGCVPVLEPFNYHRGFLLNNRVVRGDILGWPGLIHKIKSSI